MTDDVGVRRMRKALVRILPFWVGAALVVSGCSSIPEAQRDPRDPWQLYNRAMFKFNTDFDNAFMKPAAQGYQFITPEPIDRGITNFFNNIADITSAVNNALQFKLSRAGSDVGRVVVNTTVGVVGFFDVATNMGIPTYKEDFGQTLGYWGVGAGPFLMLPILGPSSVRDTVGLAGDIVVDPLFNLNEDEIYWGLVVLRTIDRRADLLAAGDLMDEAALDRYAFVRDAFLQRRRNLVHDGAPPADEEYDLFWDEEAIDQ